jgi:RNA polymerase sigma-70 factor (ECF subfamily)
MDPETKGQSPNLESFGPYLTYLARKQQHRWRQAKVDLSEVVNQTLLEAQQDLGRIQAASESEWRKWLHRILANNLVDAERRARAEKRDVRREKSIDVRLDQSSACLARWLAAQQTSPSGAAVRNEDLARLAEALEGLPEDQRAAVEYYHLEGLSLADTAEQMGKTKPAVAGLLQRGLKKLREKLIEVR